MGEMTTGLAAIAALVLLPGPILAQEGEPGAPEDPGLVRVNAEHERVKVRRAIAEEEQKIAEAEAARQRAKLPQTETQGLAGEVKVNEGAGYYATILAYRTLTDAATTIAAELAGVDGEVDHLLITTDRDVLKASGLWNATRLRLEDFRNVLSVLKAEYPCATPHPDGGLQTDADGPCPEKATIDAARQEAAGALLDTAAAGLGAADDIASFFKTNRDLYDVEVELADVALLAEVARAAKGDKGDEEGEDGEDNEDKNHKSVHLVGYNVTSVGELSKLLEELMGDKRDLADRRHRLQKQLDPDLTALAAKRKEKLKFEKQLEELGEEATKPDREALEGQIASLEDGMEPLANAEETWLEAKSRLDGPLAAFDGLAESLLTPPAKDRKTVMEVIAPIDVLRAKTGRRIVLFVDIVSQGGELHTTKRPLSEGRIHYLGGSVVVYVAVELDGTYLVSGMVPNTAAESFRAGAGIEQLVE